MKVSSREVPVFEHSDPPPRCHCGWKGSHAFPTLVQWDPEKAIVRDLNSLDWHVVKDHHQGRSQDFVRGFLSCCARSACEKISDHAHF